MTTVAAPGMAVLFPGPLRNAEYFALPESVLRIELFEGEVLMAPAPTPMHQDIVGAVFAALRQAARATGGRAFLSPLDVELDEGHVYQPDVLYLAPGQETLVGAHILGAPALIVEVLSPGTRRHDLEAKRPVYARAGVREMWTIDPDRRAIAVHRNQDGQFAQPVVVRFGDVIPSAIVEVGPADLEEF